jgi:ubiquinone/menaquinone biosynthesis C-methylase UbiE
LGGSWRRGDPFDGAFAAYLFRNVADRDALLAGLFDLLADGGVLVVQEYSSAGSHFRVQAVWTAVCWLVVVPLGWLTSRRTRLYRYLWRSVRSFDPVQTFVDRACTVRALSVWRSGRCRVGSAASFITGGHASLRPLHDHPAP